MQEYVSSILRTDTHYQWTKITGRKKGARAPSIERDQRPIEGRKKGARALLTSGQCLLKY